MIDRVGTADLCLASGLRAFANVICSRETEARVHSKRSRSNLYCGSAVRGCELDSPRSSWQFVTCALAAKSVATEYYRPNIEDCGVSAL